jgi:alpha-galactosidase
VTESSMHGAEYVPYFIKNAYPELLEKYNIPTENYKGWGTSNKDYWDKVMDGLVNDSNLTHTRTHEYASYIMEAMETNVPYKIAGNVLNTGGLISNLPEEACVEVSCLVDADGITPTRFGALPQQLAALNRTNINMQLLAVEAALTGKREPIYYAALLDPHTSAELPIDKIKALVDEMLEVNGSWLTAFK